MVKIYFIQKLRKLQKLKTAEKFIRILKTKITNIGLQYQRMFILIN